MFSKRILWGFLFIFIFLSAVALITNMPEKKDVRVYKEIVKYFPYKIKKEFGGLDITDTRTNKDLDVPNAKVFVIYDDLLKKWGKTHLKLQNSTLIILNDDKSERAKISLKNNKDIEWVKNFFSLKN